MESGHRVPGQLHQETQVRVPTSIVNIRVSDSGRSRERSYRLRVSLSRDDDLLPCIFAQARASRRHQAVLTVPVHDRQET